MKAELTHLQAFLLGGVSFYGDPLSQKGSWDSENEIGKTFQRFTEWIAENPKRPYSSHKQCMYEVHIYSRETLAKGFFEVFVGEEVTAAQLPIALSAKYIPDGEYLRITLTGKEITQDWWKKLDSEILPSIGAKRSGEFLIQAYDERFKGMDNIEDSILDVYLPIEKTCL